MSKFWRDEFAALRTEVKKTFKQDIPLSERDDWKRYLADEQKKHKQATQAIIVREKTLNDVVYVAFKLTEPEIRLIEQATKYPYGAV